MRRRKLGNSIITNKIFIVLSVLFGIISDVGSMSIQDNLVKVIDLAEGKNVMAFNDRGTHTMTDFQHCIMGRPSLSWQWNRNDEIVLNGNYQLDYEITANGIIYAPVFVLYLYNEEASCQNLEIVLTNDKEEKINFSFGLNFTGWRTAWVRYTDMNGATENHMGRHIKSIQFLAPDQGKGHLKFGPIIPNAKIYQALPMADLQVPYIEDGEDEHRGPGVNRKHLDVLDFKLPELEISKQDIADVHHIESKLTEILLDQYASDESADWNMLKQFYRNLEIGDTKKELYISFNFERHFFPKSEADIARNSISFQQVGGFLNQLAVLYHSSADSSQKADIENMFISVLNQMKKQGWVPGHARGSLHNTGYKIKRFMSAMFLMRDRLDKNGKLIEVRELCQWLTNAKECLLEPHDGDLDYFHTFSREQLIAHLLCHDYSDKAAWLKAYTNFISTRLAWQTNDQMDGFKYDGTAFHHYGHYPAYGIGAFYYASQLIYLFTNSAYAIKPEAHVNIQNALLQMRIYANNYQFPNALAGRHPFANKFDMNSEQMERAYYYFTKAGSIDGQSYFNEKTGAVYMRLYARRDWAFAKALRKAGIQAEPKPQGHWVMNNAANSIHRRNNWMLSIKGYSKYVWNAENWHGANRYGIFLSNGALDILKEGGLQASGYNEDGWDWSRLPGTTAMKVPLEVMHAAIGGHINRRSDEVFVGGVNMDGQHGAFGMMLHDAFFNLKARKSVFCFDNRIICLGSNISSWNQNYDTETTLFQNGLTNNEATQWNGKAIATFPYSKAVNVNESNRQVIADNTGNTYVVSKGELVLNRSTQYSEYQNSGKGNDGDFATAVINHGKHPRNDDYEYAILLQADNNEVSVFVNSLATTEPMYEVLQHDALAHVVRDLETKITACVVYEAGAHDIDCIKTVSEPVLIMLKGNCEQKQFSVCQPDLKWGNDRPESYVYLTIKGEWLLYNSNNVELVFSTQEETYLKLRCEMGKAVTFSCRKVR